MSQQLPKPSGNTQQHGFNSASPEQQKAYPARLRRVTGAWKSEKEKKISIQSLMTPAMFIVSADVLPISRNTACAR